MVGFALLSKVIAIKHLQVEIEVLVRVVYFRQEIPLWIRTCRSVPRVAWLMAHSHITPAGVREEDMLYQLFNKEK